MHKVRLTSDQFAIHIGKCFRSILSELFFNLYPLLFQLLLFSCLMLVYFAKLNRAACCYRLVVLHYLCVCCYVNEDCALVHTDARAMPIDIVRAGTFFRSICFTRTNYFLSQLGNNCIFLPIICNDVVNRVWQDPSTLKIQAEDFADSLLRPTPAARPPSG